MSTYKSKNPSIKFYEIDITRKQYLAKKYNVILNEKNPIQIIKINRIN